MSHPIYLFLEKKASVGETLSQASHSSVSPSSSKSPSKRVGVRTQCIDQLSKWHELLTKGAISQSQYEELKQTILKDMAVET